MNKAVIIGIIIAAGVILGAVTLMQENQLDNTESIDVDNTERKPKSFTIGLTENVGMGET